jgi:MarR family transcriptional regulator, 2-MHQ and catechol-resistance regulon repressor
MRPMGTRHRGSAVEVRALDAFVKLSRAASSVMERAHRHLADAGLTPTQFGVLEALLHLGPLCQRDLAQKLLKTGGNVTFVVGNLVRRGLVRRVRAAPNRKFVTVSLTAGGRRLVRRVFPRHVAAVVAAMSPLSAAEQETLGALLRTVGLGPGAS